MLNKKTFSVLCNIFILLSFTPDCLSTPVVESSEGSINVLFVLQQGYEICTMLDNIDPAISSQLGIQCAVCYHQVSCAEFGGYLVASQNRDQLETFKKLLVSEQVKDINLFITNIANNQQLSCIMCGKFNYWIELQDNSLIS